MKKLLSFIVLIAFWLFPSPTHAAWSQVQAVKSCTAIASATTVTCQFNANTTTGNHLFACFTWVNSGRSVTSVSDGTNSFVNLRTNTAQFAVFLACYYKENATGLTTPTVTVTWDDTSGGSILYITEFSGGLTASSLDQTNAGNGTGTTTLSPGAVTPTTDGQLIISVVNQAATNPTLTETAGTTPTYTKDPSAHTNFNSRALGFEYGVQATAAATTASWTSSATADFAAVVGTLKAAGVSTTSPRKVILY